MSVFVKMVKSISKNCFNIINLFIELDKIYSFKFSKNKDVIFIYENVWDQSMYKNSVVKSFYT